MKTQIACCQPPAEPEAYEYHFYYDPGYSQFPEREFTTADSYMTQSSHIIRYVLKEAHQDNFLPIYRDIQYTVHLCREHNIAYQSYNDYTHTPYCTNEGCTYAGDLTSHEYLGDYLYEEDIPLPSPEDSAADTPDPEAAEGN